MMPIGRLVEAIGQCVVDADFIINDNGCQLKLSINVNSRGSYFIMLDAHCFRIYDSSLLFCS